MQKILVTGTHRSGTTWVGKMLSQDRETAYVHEPFNIAYRPERFDLPLHHWFAHLPDLEDMEKFFQAYEVVFRLRRGAVPKNASSLSRKATLMRMEARAFWKRLHTERILIKDPIAVLSAEYLAERFDMQVVCMVRHPLSFCGSIKKWGWEFPFHDFLQQDLLMQRHFAQHRDLIEQFAKREYDIVDQAILLWLLLQGVIRDYQERHPDWIFLRHEDLVKDPVGELSDVFHQLKMEFTDACQDRILESGKAKKAEVDSPLFQERDRDSILTNWKNRLDEEEIDRIRNATAELRHHFYPEHMMAAEEAQILAAVG